VIEKYGIFELAYTDCDSKFKFSPRKPSMWQQVVTAPDEVITQVKICSPQDSFNTFNPSSRKCKGNWKNREVVSIFLSPGSVRKTSLRIFPSKSTG